MCCRRHTHICSTNGHILPILKTQVQIPEVAESYQRPPAKRRETSTEHYPPMIETKERSIFEDPAIGVYEEDLTDCITTAC